MLAAIGILPIVALASLPKPASAGVVIRESNVRYPVVVIDRPDYSDRRGYDNRNDDRRDYNNDRRNNAGWRDNDNRNNDWRDNRRWNNQRRVWIPGHWERGFLGIGRKWVAGRYEYR
jgi:hypothetical protein